MMNKKKAMKQPIQCTFFGSNSVFMTVSSFSVTFQLKTPITQLHWNCTLRMQNKNLQGRPTQKQIKLYSTFQVKVIHVSSSEKKSFY